MSGSLHRIAAARWVAWRAVPAGVLLALLAVAGCSSTPTPQRPAQATPPIASVPAPESATPRATPPSADVPAAWDIDLVRDERRGGHTLARHVGRTDAQLEARLRRESIAAASTYADVISAERIVARALDDDARRVRAWIDRRAPKPNLAIRYRTHDRLPTGRVMRRDDRESEDAFGAVVVLRWRGEDWYVLTSYPEDVR